MISLEIPTRTTLVIPAIFATGIFAITLRGVPDVFPPEIPPDTSSEVFQKSLRMFLQAFLRSILGDSSVMHTGVIARVTGEINPGISTGFSLAIEL